MRALLAVVALNALAALWLLDEPFGARRAESVGPAVLDTGSNGSRTPPWDLQGLHRSCLLQAESLGSSLFAR